MVQPLAELEAKMGCVDLTMCSNDELKALSVDADAGARIIAGYQTRIASAARRLEETGQGSTGEDTMRSGGTVSNKTAKKLAARAGVGEFLPSVGAGLEAGEVRPENVDTLATRTKRLSDTERKRLGEHDADLAHKSAVLSPESFSKYLGQRLRGIKDPDPDDGLSEAQRQAKAAWLELERGFDGMWELRGKLDDVRGQQLNDWIEQHATGVTPEANRTTANDRAAALHDLARRGAAGSTFDDDGLTPPVRPGVAVIVDEQTMTDGPHERSTAQTWGGQPTDPAAGTRAACDADVYAVLIDRFGVPRRVGRTRRTATRHQRLALRALYYACPLDGTPFAQCEIHHVNAFFEDGGETEIDNLLPISMDWHHRVHDRGWTIKMAKDRSLTVWRPDGTIERRIPPPTPISRE